MILLDARLLTGDRLLRGVVRGSTVISSGAGLLLADAGLLLVLVSCALGGDT